MHIIPNRRRFLAGGHRQLHVIEPENVAHPPYFPFITASQTSPSVPVSVYEYHVLSGAT